MFILKGRTEDICKLSQVCLDVNATCLGNPPRCECNIGYELNRWRIPTKICASGNKL